jgi:hypothetical protein
MDMTGFEATRPGEAGHPMDMTGFEATRPGEAGHSKKILLSRC